VKTFRSDVFPAEMERVAFRRYADKGAICLTARAVANNYDFALQLESVAAETRMVSYFRTLPRFEHALADHEMTWMIRRNAWWRARRQQQDGCHRDSSDTTTV
jgi:hypothetical protein